MVHAMVVVLLGAGGIPLSLVLAVVAGAMVVQVPTHVLVAGVSVVQEPKVVHHLSMEAPAPMELLFSKMALA